MARSRSAPCSIVSLRRRPLPEAMTTAYSPSSATQSGFGLLGIIVGLALSAAVVGVAYGAYRTNQQASEVSVSTQLTSDVTQRALASYASAADFSGLSTQSAEAINLFPKNILQGSQPVNTWGGAIDLTAVNIAGASGPGNNNGFALTFEQVPQSACVSFATNAGHAFQDVKVNNVSVLSGTQVNVPTASTLCNGSSTDTVQFIMVKASPNGATQPELTPCVPPPSNSQTIACPSGQLSSTPPYSANGITQTNQGFCEGAYGLPGVTPWATVSNTCVPVCVAPAPVVTPGSQTVSCPAGQVTIASGASTFPQTNTQTTTYTCQLPIGSATPIVNPPTPWSPLASSVCAPQCIAPHATTGSQGATGMCPAGQVTSSGATTFAQTQTRSITYSCPAPTGGYTTAYGPWSALTPAVSSVCAPKCVAPPTSTSQNTQWLSASQGCSSGQSGTYSYQYQQTQTITTTYSCPAPQGNDTSSSSAGGWSNTGATRNVVNTCAPNPPPPPAITYTTGNFSLITLPFQGLPDFNGQSQTVDAYISGYWGCVDAASGNGVSVPQAENYCISLFNYVATGDASDYNYLSSQSGVPAQAIQNICDTATGVSSLSECTFWNPQKSSVSANAPALTWPTSTTNLPSTASSLPAASYPNCSTSGQTCTCSATLTYNGSSQTVTQTATGSGVSALQSVTLSGVPFNAQTYGPSNANSVYGCWMYVNF